VLLIYGEGNESDRAESSSHRSSECLWAMVNMVAAALPPHSLRPATPTIANWPVKGGRGWEAWESGKV